MRKLSGTLAARALVAGLLALLLFTAGCASPASRASPPLLSLSPASLGRELEVLQRLDIEAAGRTGSLEVALEVDAQSVRMAFIQLGHTVARLAWDGDRLEKILSPGWPDVVSAERVLSDLQLVWWPAAAVQAALPAGWTLTESPQIRELRQGDKLVTSVHAVAPGHIQIVQHTDGYTVHVFSQGAAPVFTAP